MSFDDLPTLTETLVHACEEAEAAQLGLQLTAVQLVSPHLDARLLSVAGGVAALTVAKFGRKLNHVTGAGLTEAIRRDALEPLTAAYRARGLQVELDLCPYAPVESLATLAQHGFKVNAFNNMYVRSLRSSQPLAATPARCRARTLSEHEHEQFVSASVRGFASHSVPHSFELRMLLARAATVATETTLCAVEVAGDMIATAAVAIVPTRLGLCAVLHTCSTAPEFRGHGAQAALLAERLRVAREKRAEFAIVCARPGTSSARNAQRSGFGLAFTKPTFRG
jgi:predicted GNAT family acetyltransferase